MRLKTVPCGCWKSWKALIILGLTLISPVVLTTDSPGPEGGEGIESSGVPEDDKFGYPNTDGIITNAIPLPSEFEFDPLHPNHYAFDYSYHWNAPTNTVVEFSKLRQDIAVRFKNARKRLSELDVRITDLINGTVQRLIDSDVKNKELIQSEVEKREEEVLKLASNAADKFRSAERETDNVKKNLDLTNKTVKENKKLLGEDMEAFTSGAGAGMEKITGLITGLLGSVKKVEEDAKEKEKERAKCD